MFFICKPNTSYTSLDQVTVDFVAGVLICNFRLWPALLRVCTFKVENLALQYIALFFVKCQFLFKFPVDFCDFLTTNQLIHTPNVPHCSNGLWAAASWYSCYCTVCINFLQSRIRLVLLQALFGNSVIIRLAPHCFSISKFLIRIRSSAVIFAVL